jgi:diguanylate cyclase (GGDEF)-like protein/PAS domain S-box-containing protein
MLGSASTANGMQTMKTQGLPATLSAAEHPAASRLIPFSQQLKKTLLIALPLLAFFGLAILGYYSQQVAEVERHAHNMNQYANQVLSLKVRQILRNITGDARLLVNNPLLPRVLSNPRRADAQLLAEQWAKFCAQKRIYDQIRLLNLEGHEITRINLTTTGANIVARDQLQQKNSRYYFKEAISLPPGQIYLSPLDLNIENNEIEQPIKPMLRIAVSVVDENNNKIGLLVLNYLAANLMQEIDAYSVLVESKNLLLNQQGYYLHGVARDREWLFMYPEKNQSKGIFASDYADVWQHIKQNRQYQLTTDQGIFSFQWLSCDEVLDIPGSFSRQFVMVSLISSQQLMALKAPYREVALGASLLALPTILLFAAVTSHFRLREQSIFDRLRNTEANQRLILESVGEGILGIDATGRLTFANSCAERLTGYLLNEMLGRPLHSLIHICENNHGQHAEKACPLQQSLINGQPHHAEGDIFLRKNGNTFPVEYTCNPIIKNGRHQGGVVSFFDITARKQAEQRIAYLVLYNPLTDLPNKRLLLDRLEQQVATARTNNQISALLYIDIDRFKQINDAMGHDSGDKILIETAQRLQYITQEGDTIAHIGSDEFALLLANHTIDEENMAHSAQITADDVMLILQQPYYLERDSIRLTVSIGITLFPFGDETASSILAQADTAVASAKQDGCYTTRFFRSEMEHATKEWLHIHNRMLEAVAHDAFSLVYQPKVEKHGRLIGIEALLRWNDHDLGIVKPVDFIPIAEQSGLILQISEFVMSRVCRQIKEWSDTGLINAVGRIAINISPKQISEKNFVNYILEHVNQAGIPANILELEITEQSLLDNTAAIQDKLQTLREHGINFSIDDFGTGYSSLAYLQQLPLDRLKIDRAFITDVDKIHDRQSIVDAIIFLAKSLTIDVIAEGVETQEEMNYLLKAGCLEFQGYYFHRPLSSEHMTRLLHKHITRSNNPAIA